jgi:hypothetical protein
MVVVAHFVPFLTMAFLLDGLGLLGGHEQIGSS